MKKKHRSKEGDFSKLPNFKSIYNKLGYTLIELMVVVSMTAILSGVAVFNMKDLFIPSSTANDLVIAQYKLVRSKAISKTRAYLFEPVDSTTLGASFRDKCNSTESWVEDDSLAMNLPADSWMQLPPNPDHWWSVCINSRGQTDANIEITIEDEKGNISDIEILLLGTVAGVTTS